MLKSSITHLSTKTNTPLSPPPIFWGSESFCFVQQQSGILNQFIDTQNILSLYIFKSGWKNKYHCILEWGEYEETDTYLYTAEEIKSFFGIEIFLRKDKLNKINESTL